MDAILERFNFENVENLLQELGEKAVPPRVFDLWDDMLSDVLTAEKRLFATERGWKDIKTSTVQRKSRDKDARVRSNSYKTNVGTGALRDHMTTRGANAQPLKVDADELRVGIGNTSDVFYGKFQAAQGRDPLVSKAVIRRIAGQRIQAHLTGA